MNGQCASAPEIPSAVVEAIARRAAKAAARAELAERRAFGLALRHATKLAREGDAHADTH